MLCRKGSALFSQLSDLLYKSHRIIGYLQVKYFLNTKESRNCQGGEESRVRYEPPPQSQWERSGSCRRPQPRLLRPQDNWAKPGPHGGSTRPAQMLGPQTPGLHAAAPQRLGDADRPWSRGAPLSLGGRGPAQTEAGQGAAAALRVTGADGHRQKGGR